jgi:DNA-binding HxlR family transcriptional regulator
MASTDLLSNICDELDARLRELRWVVDEYESLLDAAAALELAGEQESVAPARRRGRPPGKRSAGRSAAAPKPVADARTTADASTAAESSPRAPKKPTARRPSVAAPKRAQRGAAAVAILAALEHGSHTVSELAVVTAMSGAIINNNLRRLQQAGTITRTKREGDGKAAYALAATPA